MAKTVIILNGPTSVGKTTLGRYIVKRFGAHSLSMSKLLKDEAAKLGLSTTEFVELVLHGSNELKIQFVIREVLSLFERYNVVCIESVYNQKEIDYIKEAIKNRYPESRAYSIYLNANFNLRVKRLMRRNNLDERAALLKTALTNLTRAKLGMTDINYDLQEKHETVRDTKRIIKRIGKILRR